jgi:hypothetical protein
MIIKGTTLRDTAWFSIVDDEWSAAAKNFEQKLNVIKLS